jgi:hypothetical protein
VQQPEGQCELEFVKKNGDVMSVQISDKAVNDADGKFLFSQATVIDISSLIARNTT